jgi:4-aminobutyrate aminotransferase-like enzyme
MVWGVEAQDHAGHSAAEWANAIVLACYRGENGGDGIHLLGPLAKKVVRIAPPLTITPAEARSAMELFRRLLDRVAHMAQQHATAPSAAAAGSRF